MEELTHGPGRALWGDDGRKVDSGETCRGRQEPGDSVTSGPLPGVQQVGEGGGASRRARGSGERLPVGPRACGRGTPGDQGGTLDAE